MRLWGNFERLILSLSSTAPIRKYSPRCFALRSKAAGDVVFPTCQEKTIIDKAKSTQNFTKADIHAGQLKFKMDKHPAKILIVFFETMV